KVRMFDPAPFLMERGSNGHRYLETDTHWRPETMELVAERLADFLKLPPAAASTSPSIIEKEIVGRGDIATMLKLTRGDKFFPSEKVTIRQVVTGNGLWRPSKEADVLLLGDSFSNIFSFEAMGWGESAGFAEHLSVALRRPIDCILRNSDAAVATGEILRKQLARGRDPAAWKKLGIWGFSAAGFWFWEWQFFGSKTGRSETFSLFEFEGWRGNRGERNGRKRFARAAARHRAIQGSHRGVAFGRHCGCRFARPGGVALPGRRVFVEHARQRVDVSGAVADGRSGQAAFTAVVGCFRTIREIQSNRVGRPGLATGGACLGRAVLICDPALRNESTHQKTFSLRTPRFMRFMRALRSR